MHFRSALRYTYIFTYITNSPKSDFVKTTATFISKIHILKYGHTGMTKIETIPIIMDSNIYICI